MNFSTSKKPALPLLAVLILVLLPVAVFGQAVHFKFLNYDDNLYISENPHIRDGLTPSGIRWAFQADLLFDSVNADYWQPLTFISRMADMQLWGLNAGGHHLTNLILHILNTLLVFLLFSTMTGFRARSFWIAAAFAVHPLQIDAVVWVTARKDVLSSFWTLLALLAYTRYSRKPSRASFTGVCVFFILAILSKPMTAILPGLMLLLDFWPLARLGQTPLWRLFYEKILWFILAAFSILTTLFTRSSTMRSAMDLVHPYHFPHDYLWYLGKTLYPHGLVVRYPDAGVPSGLLFYLGACAILLSTALLVLARKRHPYFLFGWLWFLAALLPSIGLTRNNRFMYLPILGLLLTAAWAGALLFKKLKIPPRTAAIAGTGSILLWALISSCEARHWRDSFRLFHHVLQVTPKNYVAENSIGLAYSDAGNMEEAIDHFTKAIWLNPGYAEAHNNLAVVLSRQGKHRVALTHYEAALTMKPDYTEAYNNIGVSLAEEGKFEEATFYYRKFLDKKPDFMDARLNLGDALYRAGKPEQAIEEYQTGLSLDPGNAEICRRIAIISAALGRDQEALDYFARALKLQPDFALGYTNLGDFLSSKGDLKSARKNYERALQANPGFAEAHNNLGVIAAREGLREEAVRHFKEALRLNPEYADAQKNLQAARSDASRADRPA